MRIPLGKNKILLHSKWRIFGAKFALESSEKNEGIPYKKNMDVEQKNMDVEQKNSDIEKSNIH